MFSGKPEISVKELRNKYRRLLFCPERRLWANLSLYSLYGKKVSYRQVFYILRWRIELTSQKLQWNLIAETINCNRYSLIPVYCFNMKTQFLVKAKLIFNKNFLSPSESSHVVLEWLSPKGYVKNFVDLVHWFWSRSAVREQSLELSGCGYNAKDMTQHFTLLLGAGSRGLSLTSENKGCFFSSGARLAEEVVRWHWSQPEGLVWVMWLLLGWVFHLFLSLLLILLWLLFVFLSHFSFL